MRVQVRLVARTGQQWELNDQRVEWPEGWPVPPEGAEVELPTLPGDGGINCYWVRHVIWHPLGDPDSADPTPFVYLVLGDRLR